MTWKKNKALVALLVFNAVIALAAITITVSRVWGVPQETEALTLTTGDVAFVTAFVTATFSVTASTLASGFAIRAVATAGFAASAERPELRTYILILGGLAEGIAIYGLLVAILILGKV